MDLKNKVIVITGASSGIGKELALQLAPAGNKLVLVARREELLNDVAAQVKEAGSEALVIPADVSKKDQVESFINKSHQAFGRIDILINNAGLTTRSGALCDNSEEEIRYTIDTNFMSAIYAVRAVVPLMEKTGGQIVFVSSIIGKRGIPNNATYCASKFALQGLTESIRLELKKKNIHVLTLCPPGVDTPFFEVNGRAEKRNYPLQPVDKIAKLMIRAMRCEKRDVLLTWNSKALYWTNVFFPKMLDWVIMKAKGV